MRLTPKEKMKSLMVKVQDSLKSINELFTSIQASQSSTPLKAKAQKKKEKKLKK